MTSRKHGNQERRSEPRFTTHLKAIVDDAQHGTLVFIASEFNRSGAFLKRHDRSTPLPLIGGVIRITFSWPLETHIPPVRVEAMVVRQTDAGIGVKFEIA